MKSNIRLLFSLLTCMPSLFCMAPELACSTRLIDQLEKPIQHINLGNIDAVKIANFSQTQLNASLTFAVLKRNIKMIQALLALGAQPSQNPTAVALAYQLNDVEIINLLK